MELNKENLYREYIKNNKSRKECSKIFCCSEALIAKRLRIYEIKKDKSLKQETYKKAIKEKYGVENVAQLSTNIFKNNNPAKNKELKLKASQTYKDRYNDDIKNKKEKTNIAKYGAKTFAESKYFKDIILKKNPNYLIISNKELLENKIKSLNKPTFYDLCNQLGYSYSPIFKAVQKFGLGGLIQKSYSKTNIYWHDLIYKELGIDLEYEGSIFDSNYDKVDLYDDERKIAIDINPTVTHNTQFNPFHPQNKSHISTVYHFNRAKVAEKNGWLLYQIFDWDDETKVIRQLKSIFGLNKKIYARKCNIKKISKLECKDFMNKWHSQGSSENIAAYGLYNEGNLVSVMSFSRARFNHQAEYELIRYAGGEINVVGGASKLLKAFIREYNPKTILTYSDYGKGHGLVYQKIGFRFVGFAGLTALYAPLNKEGIAYKTQRASREYKKNGKDFKSCKEYFNSKKWYRINDANNKIWLWENTNYNSEN